MPIKIILNPTADLGHGIEQRPDIENAARPSEAVAIVQTQRPGHAFELAGKAIEDGCDLLVAAGGDGTIHEVVNAIYYSGQAERVKLGIIPIGTGNDFAYALGIPLDDVPAAMRTIYGGRVRLADLAEVVDDHGRREVFENNFGVGLDANVVIRTGEITQVRGFVKYMVGVLTTLYRDFSPLRLSMRFDDEKCVADVLFISLGLGPRHGGGFMLTPGAVHDDDLVDSCMAEMMSRPKALSLLNAAVKGTHIKESVVTMRRSKLIEICADTAMPIHIDGEIFARVEDNVRCLSIHSLPDALQVIV
jgi:YegS/Rv2252/BmrU family lipid kinase